MVSTSFPLYSILIAQLYLLVQKTTHKEEKEVPGVLHPPKNGILGKNALNTDALNVAKCLYLHLQIATISICNFLSFTMNVAVFNENIKKDEYKFL